MDVLAKSSYMQAVGYGGSCFPKDVKALVHTGIDNNYHMEVIEAVERVNERQKSIVYDKLTILMGDVKGKTIALLGIGFQAGNR